MTRIRLLSLCVALGALVAHRGGAQAPDDTRGQYETRAQLASDLSSAVASGRTGDATRLRERLRDGDFHEGDKVIIAVQTGGTTATDTAVVRAGRLLRVTSVPGIPDIPLRGVFRAELQDTVAAHIGRYVKTPVVHVLPLVRIAVLGGVLRPGWYFTAADVPLTDVIMLAGGPSPEADLGKSVLRRDREILMQPDQLRTALAEGLSIDRLHLRPGDELVIGMPRGWSVSNTLQAIAAALGGVVAVVALARH